jgi:hypothetical protein
MLRNKLTYRDVAASCEVARYSRPQDDAGKIPVPQVLSAESIEHILFGTVPYGIPTQNHGEILLT